MNNIDIKELRVGLNVSQEKFAEMLGVHPRTIQNWESGTKIPNSKHTILRNMMTENNKIEMSKCKERLKRFLSHLGIGQSQFERNVGLPNGQIDSIEEDTLLSTISKITETYPELNEEWLKTGNGDMLKNTVTQNNVDGNNIQGYNVTATKSEIDGFISLIRTKDEQLNKCQSQIDRLIGIIEQLNKNS